MSRLFARRIEHSIRQTQSKGHSAIPEIVNDKELEGSSVLEIHASDTNIREYLNRKMPKLSGFVMRDRQLQEDIYKAIMGSIGGMYVASPHIATP